MTARTKLGFEGRVQLLWNYFTNLLFGAMKSVPTIPGFGGASSSGQLHGGFPSLSALRPGGTGDAITDLLTLRYGSRIDSGELNRLQQKQAQLKNWKHQIMNTMGALVVAKMTETGHRALDGGGLLASGA